MKKYKYFGVILGLLLLSGCATSQDLQRTEMAFAQKTAAMERQASTTEKKVSAMGEDLKALRENVSTIRKSAADEGADITDVRERSAEITGRLDVLEKKAASTEMAIADLSTRLSRLERFLEPEEEKAPALSPMSGAVPKSSQDAYAAAMNLFEKERYAAAQTAFENILSRYPDTDQAAPAQYWLAESLYFQGLYEKAVLEYDKVVKKYAEGNKTPYALLKQGLCFIKLKDETTARAVFQQVIQKYPSSNAAEVAQAKMKEMQ